MVSTDDWVPGINGAASFAKVVGGNKFWLMILEK
jgi:hypothetical protein